MRKSVATGCTDLGTNTKHHLGCTAHHGDFLLTAERCEEWRPKPSPLQQTALNAAGK
jgi:hypothetical protein